MSLQFFFSFFFFYVLCGNRTGLFRVLFERLNGVGVRAIAVASGLLVWFPWNTSQHSSPEESSVPSEHPSAVGLDQVVPVWSDFDNDARRGPLFWHRVLYQHVISNLKWRERLCRLVVSLYLHIFCSPRSFFELVRFMLPANALRWAGRVSQSGRPNTIRAGDAPPSLGVLRNISSALANFSGSNDPDVDALLISFFIVFTSASALPFECA